MIARIGLVASLLSGALVFTAFEHDPGVPLARLVEDKPGRYKAIPEPVPVPVTA